MPLRTAVKPQFSPSSSPSEVSCLVQERSSDRNEWLFTRGSGPSVFCLYHPLLIVAGLTGFSFITYFFCEI